MHGFLKSTPCYILMFIGGVSLLAWGFPWIPLPDKPDYLYAAGISALAVMATSWIQNLNARKNLITTLDHAKSLKEQELAQSLSLKEQERIMTLKKEIYLPLIESGFSLIDFLAGFAQHKNEAAAALAAGEPLKTFARCISRASLVAPLFLIREMEQLKADATNTFVDCSLSFAKYKVGQITNPDAPPLQVMKDFVEFTTKLSSLTQDLSLQCSRALVLVRAEISSAINEEEYMTFIKELNAKTMAKLENTARGIQP